MADRPRTNVSGERDTRSIIRTTALVVLILIVAAFAIDNRQSVRIGWIVGDSRLPLIFVLVITAVIGVLIGMLLSLLRRRGNDD